MPRMRTLKPEACTSESLADVDRGVRWTFATFWTHCDDDGRATYNLRLIKAAIYPLDDAMTLDALAADFDQLERIGAVCRYTVDGRDFIHVPTFAEHQHPNRPVASKLPPCPKTDHSVSTHAQHSEPAVSQHQPRTPVVVVGVVEVDGEGVGEGAGSASAPTTAQTLVGEWIERSSKRPPSQVVGQVAKIAGQLLAEGIDPNDIRRGLAAWMTKGLHPSTLPSVVNEVMNAPTLRSTGPQRRTTDDKVRDGLALAQRLANEHPIARREIS